MKQYHELFINDVNAGIYGIWLEKAPAIPIAKERGTWQNMPGFDGGYFVSENALDAVELKLDIFIEAGRDMDRVITYLMDAQTVRIAPWLWEWEVSTKETAPTVSEWLDIPGEGYVVEIAYRAKPYRVVWPRAGCDVTLAPGQSATINNPYATALPVITLRNGCTVTVGSAVMTASGGDVVIDCGKRTVSNPNHLTVQTSGGEYRPVWAVLKPGANSVSATGAGGSVNIKADWRLR